MFDISKPAKFHLVSPYEMLLYATGHHLWVTTPTWVVDNYGRFGFEDLYWKRDSHCVLVKRPSKLNKKQQKDLIAALAGILNQDEFVRILHIMINFFSTVSVENGTEKKKVDDALERLQAFDDIGQQDFNDEEKKVMLHHWFNKFFSGPLLLTRSLSIQTVSSTDLLIDKVTKYIRERYDEGFNKYDIVKVTLLDSAYYVIPGTIISALKWAHNAAGDFVEIFDPDEEMVMQPHNIVHCFNTHYKDGAKKSPETELTCCVCKKRNGFYLSLRYGSDVFWGVTTELHVLFNSAKFHLWAKNSNLTIWFGRDEADKLEDIRNLKLQIQNLTKKNRALTQKLSKR